MKKLKLTLVVCALAVANANYSQESDNADSTGLGGDNFSLQGALELFKKATSLEDFEKQLNASENDINNLDLNGDGDIDYVRVIDNKDGVAHAIVLQVPVNETESQDIAVIEVEKNGDESALVQILGDEELYGESTIIEPLDEKEIKKKGPSSPEIIASGIIVNVWLWPCVKFIYAPRYVLWVSPYRWNYYPNYWKPWRPHPWRWHHNHCVHYHAHHHVVYTHRAVVAHKVYAPHRRTSVVVVNRHKTAHVNYKARKSNPNPGNRNNSQQVNKQQNRQNGNKVQKENRQGGNKQEKANRNGGNKTQQAPRNGGRKTSPKGGGSSKGGGGRNR